jgi:hypothetical protein
MPNKYSKLNATVSTPEEIEARLQLLKDRKIETEEELEAAINESKLMFGELNVLLAETLLELKDKSMLVDDDDVQTYVFTTSDGNEQVMYLRNADAVAITHFKDGVGTVVSPNELLTESSHELVQQIMADPNLMKHLIQENE